LKLLLAGILAGQCDMARIRHPAVHSICSLLHIKLMQSDGWNFIASRHTTVSRLAPDRMSPINLEILQCATLRFACIREVCVCKCISVGWSLLNDAKADIRSTAVPECRHE
jgi:hypothetical protein